MTSDSVYSRHFTITFLTNLSTVLPPSSTSDISSAISENYRSKAIRFYLKTRVVAFHPATWKPTIIAPFAYHIPQKLNTNIRFDLRPIHSSRPEHQQPVHQSPAPYLTTTTSTTASSSPKLYLMPPTVAINSSRTQLVTHDPDINNYVIIRPHRISRPQHQQPIFLPPRLHLTASIAASTSSFAQLVLHHPSITNYIIARPHHISLPRYQQSHLPPPKLYLTPSVAASNLSPAQLVPHSPDSKNLIIFLRLHSTRQPHK